MIRFVDLRPAEIAGCRFAFWNTVNDSWEEFNGDGAWGTVEEFKESAEIEGVDWEHVERRLHLIPAEFLEPWDMMEDERRWKVVEDV